MPVSGARPGRAGDRGREGSSPQAQAVDPRRVRLLRSGEAGTGGVLYWMSRDQRTRDNWALLFAQELAFERKAPLAVMFCLAPRFLDAGLRQYHFMMEGLKQVERDLAEKNIPFFLIPGNPGRTIPDFIRRRSIGALVTDFDSLRIKREWKDEVRRKIDIPFFEVDAHNIIPCWAASDKQEYAAKS